jgi:hypothetical protein
MPLISTVGHRVSRDLDARFFGFEIMLSSSFHHSLSCSSSFSELASKGFVEISWEDDVSAPIDITPPLEGNRTPGIPNTSGYNPRDKTCIYIEAVVELSLQFEYELTRQ